MPRSFRGHGVCYYDICNAKKDRLIAVCRKLQMPIPELYLQMSPIPNAWTSGNTRTYIVVTLGLIRRFQEEELDAVLAHECGHILCHHVLYSMLANAIFDLGDSLMDSILGSIGNAAIYDLLGNKITTPQTGRIYIQNGKKITWQ